MTRTSSQKAKSGKKRGYAAFPSSDNFLNTSRLQTFAPRLAFLANNGKEQMPGKTASGHVGRPPGNPKQANQLKGCPCIEVILSASMGNTKQATKKLSLPQGDPISEHGKDQTKKHHYVPCCAQSRNNNGSHYAAFTLGCRFDRCPRVSHTLNRSSANHLRVLRRFGSSLCHDNSRRRHNLGGGSATLEKRGKRWCGRGRTSRRRGRTQRRLVFPVDICRFFSC